MNDNIGIMDAISITISSMTIVLLILLIISLVVASFKYIFKEDKAKTSKQINEDIEIVENSEEDEEKIVACLAASIMAGEGKINPNLHIKKVTRIR